MALPSDTFTGTDLASYIPSVWGEQINDFFKKRQVFASFFTDRSDELVGGGNTLVTPGLTEMTAYAKNNATAVTLNSPTETSIQLVVDQWYEVSFVIEDMQAAQVKQSYSIMSRYASNAGYTIAQKLETAIAALFSGFTGNAAVGASNAALADSDIRNAIATLETQSIPGLYDGDVALFVHPNTFWKRIQGIDKFALAINTAGDNNPLNEPKYRVYGIPVYITENVPNVSGASGRYNILAHKDSIHFATASLGLMSNGGMVGSSGVRVQSNYLPEYLGTLTTVDILYGVIENRDAAAVQVLDLA